MTQASRTVHARIHRLIGQLVAIESMLNDKRTCADVLNQISAVRAGVEQVATIVFRREIERLAVKKKLSSAELQRLTELYSRTT